MNFLLTFEKLECVSDCSHELTLKEVLHRTKSLFQKGMFFMFDEKIEVTKKVTNKIDYEHLAQIKIAPCGDLLVMKGVKSYSNEPKIKRLNKDAYLVLSTGEVRYYKQNEKGISNISRFKDRFEYLKLLINKNFQGRENERFVTLTYYEPEFNAKKAADDFNLFKRRFLRKYPHCEFIRVIEPHERVGWHFHILFKDMVNENLPLTDDEMRKLWKYGEVDIKIITNPYGLSLYFYPSFSKDGKGKPKAKYNRLKCYPKGFNVFSKSRGIEKPEWIVVTPEQLSEIAKAYNLTYSALYDIILTDEEGFKKLINQTVKQEYMKNKSSMVPDFSPELSGERKEVDE